MRVRFWGVRGSTPTPDRRNARYGGNTTCLEVRLTDDTIIVLDCGSGLRAFGKNLYGEYGDRPVQAYIFLTHFHWDHIQGIPFFLPLYKRGNTFLFHSVMQRGSELQATIEGQMANPYFPVNMNTMAAARHFYELGDAPINVNGAIVTTCALNHPQGCVAYRIDADGARFVLATDTEPGSPPHDKYVRDLCRDADLLVYDCQYTPEQLAGEKRGWGHSSWAEGVKISKECGVKRLILFHHDPDSDDSYIDTLVARAQQAFPAAMGAAEGLEFELPSGEYTQTRLVEPSNRREERRYHLELPVRLQWQDPSGKVKEGRGVTQDISRSGIFLVAPPDIKADQPLRLELVIPDEITHRGDVGVQLEALPVRHVQMNGNTLDLSPCVGLAARLNPPEKKPASKPKASHKSKR